MLGVAALSAALLVSAVIILILQKWRRRKRRVTRKLVSAKLKSYAAVGIRSHARACTAVRELYGKRFLADEAPAVPVVGCTVQPCPCRYIHFTDRRAEENRRAQFAPSKRLREAGNDRRRSDRRRMPAPA